MRGQRFNAERLKIENNLLRNLVSNMMSDQQTNNNGNIQTRTFHHRGRNPSGFGPNFRHMPRVDRHRQMYNRGRGYGRQMFSQYGREDFRFEMERRREDRPRYERYDFDERRGGFRNGGRYGRREWNSRSYY